MAIIYGAPAGSSGSIIGKTVMIKTEDGAEIFAVATEQEIILTASSSEDIREGKTAITGEGFITGTAKFPKIAAGQVEIASGAAYSIPITDPDILNYTDIQGMITQSGTYAVEKVVINNSVYEVNSEEPIAAVSVNSQAIDLNITNNTENQYTIYYIVYKNA